MSALVLNLVLAAPHGDLRVYFQSAMADTKFQQKVFDQVARAWAQPKVKPSPGRKAVVQAIVARSGKLISATVSTGSGSAPWDAAALAAVQHASPFAPLPASFPADSVEVHFHLTWAL
jgi:protein TonB